MSKRINRERILRRLAAAEGYLELDLPLRSLEILQSRPEWGTMQFEACFLTGEAMRSLGQFRDALKPLEIAANLRPGHMGVALALGWCYKRTNRLAQAIDALERAERAHPNDALLHYNLACYWSLAGNPSRAVDELTLAVDLDSRFREKIPAESDFDSLRGNPDFDQLALGPAPTV